MKIVPILFLVTLLASCTGYTYRPWQAVPAKSVVAPYDAIIYKKTLETLEGYEKATGPSLRTGVVCNSSVLGLVSWGDLSVELAQKKGMISKVEKVEVAREETLLGLVGKQCLVVRGS